MHDRSRRQGPRSSPAAPAGSAGRSSSGSRRRAPTWRSATEAMPPRPPRRPPPSRRSAAERSRSRQTSRTRPQPTAVVKAVLEAFGKVDILVNNAGITRDDLIMRMSEEAWRDVLETNLFGAFYMTKAVTRPMLKARRGRIVNITSVSGQAGQMGQANYSSAKAGLIGLTKATARELASRVHHRQRRRPGVRPDRAHAGPARGAPGGDHRPHAARPLRDDRGGRQRGGLPGQRRRGLHHRPGARRRRRPGDDVGP